MLILTRRPTESIKIGDEITVTVLGVVGNSVRFGIDAPKDVPVHRKEIYDRIQRQASGEEPNGNIDEQEIDRQIPRPMRRQHPVHCQCRRCDEQWAGARR